MFGTLDFISHDQAVGEMDPFMSAKSIGCVILVVRGPVDRIGLTIMIESDDAFFLDIVRAAGLDPIFQHQHVAKSPSKL
ncbi:hypothetical protein AU467_20285 [Mesorhizobium loti]|uniref:Uncharacterized protein n=1 Tax=Rhizobium loti TaxID=381 RepID=A0A117N3T0_RHILI|nr:hypothetical protein AU467_20285 [Mesorhizobium loti]